MMTRLLRLLRPMRRVTPVVAILAAGAIKSQSAPNILYLLADQWRASATGYAGDPNVRTPNLDRLAEESLNFGNAVSVLPVCTPHRAALMTGRYPTSTGMFLNDAHLPDEELCLAEIFGAAGYATAYIGKWHLDGHGRQSYIPPERRQGWQYWKAAECDHDYNHSHYYSGDSNVKRYWEGYDAFAQTRDAQQYLRDHAGGGQPFVLMVSFGTPHFPHATAPAEFKALYPPENIQLASNVPPGLQARARREAQGYYAHCTALDRCIGDLLRTLEETGLSTNTIVVFSSDHGEMLGSQGVIPTQKQVAWSEAAQVPFLLRMPGLGGRHVTTPITTPDVLPTLLGLAGVPVPKTVEGEDLSPLLRSGRDEDRAALYMSVTPFTSGVSPDKSREYRAIRTSRYTYVRSLDGPWLLFDDVEDSFQTNNLVGKSDHTALVKELDARLQAELERVGDDFRPGEEHIAEWGYAIGAHGSVPYAATDTQAQTPRRNPAARPAVPSPVEISDVVVYGSTPGGFCAAIAAAREGASVILLEPTEHVGGLSTGGLSHCDSNQMRRETLMGLFDEWHRRVVKDYTDRGLAAPYDPALKDTAKWTFEPHVAMRVTRAMLKEAGVTVLTGRYLTAVKKDGARITSLVTKEGTFSAKVFVDGSYEGDLMAAAGVDWTIGREGRAEFGESLAGKQYPKKEMDIGGFDDAGNLLPLVTTSDAGPDAAGDKNIMTYSFRLCLTRDPANRVRMPAPANYDPARFELARRAFRAGILGVGLDLYPLPGGKLDGNNSIGGQLSLGLVGGGKAWHNADEAGRAKIWEDHKQYTLEFLHFLRTDPAVPQNVRSKFADLGLCKDEFVATDHFSPALYVRESRRMKGMYVLSQKDIIDSPEKEDAIAISSFPIDSHDCQRVALKNGGVINEGTIFPVRVPGTGVGYAYHVPYRSVLPQAAQCSNLLVPVALSSTHVAMSSLRIEGAWMVIGQSAGVAAALVARQNLAVQDLPYPVLRERLLAQGQVLKLPPSPVSKAALKAPDFIPVKSFPSIVLDDANAKLEGVVANPPSHTSDELKPPPMPLPRGPGAFPVEGHQEEAVAYFGVIRTGISELIGH